MAYNMTRTHKGVPESSCRTHTASSFCQPMQCGNVCYADGNEQCVDANAGTGEDPAFACQCNAGFGDCDIDTPG